MKAWLMTVGDVVNPNKWGDGIRNAVIAALIGSVMSGAAMLYSSGEFHAVTEYHLTTIDGKIDRVERAQDEAKKALEDQSQKVNAASTAAATLKDDLEEGRKQNRPRIDRLEDAVGKMQPDIAAIKEDVQAVRDTTKRHDNDFQAILSAVAPKPDWHTRGN